MIFELTQDFNDALAAMPQGHPKRRMLELLGEAIRRHIHFIASHPTTLFQCMWNTCCWNPVGSHRKFYVTEQLARSRWKSLTSGSNIWEDEKLFSNSLNILCTGKITASITCLINEWRLSDINNKRQRPWFKAVRPHPLRLTTNIRVIFREPQWGIRQIEKTLSGLLVIGNWNGDIYVLDLATQVIMDKIASAENTAFALSPDYSKIVYWKPRKTLTVAELYSGKFVSRQTLNYNALNKPQKHKTIPEIIEWSEEGIVLNFDSQCFVIKVESSEKTNFASNTKSQREILQSVIPSPHRTISISKNRKLSAVLLSSGNEIEIWDMEKIELLGSFKLDAKVNLLAMSDTGEKVAVSTTCRPITIKILDIQGADPKQYIIGDDRINCACFIDKKTLVAGSDDRSCYIIDISRHQLQELLWGSQYFLSGGTKLSPCERFISVQSGIDETLAYDAESGLCILACFSHNTPPSKREKSSIEIRDTNDAEGSEILYGDNLIGWLPNRFSTGVTGSAENPVIAGYETHIGTAVYIYRMQNVPLPMRENSKLSIEEFPSISRLWKYWGCNDKENFTVWLRTLVNSLCQFNMDDYIKMLEKEVKYWSNIGKDVEAEWIRRVIAKVRSEYLKE